MPHAHEEMPGGKFTLNSFLDAVRQIRKLGSFRSILQYVPGMTSVLAELNIKRIEGIISSMTPFERENPEQINILRRLRISQGCGIEPVEVNRLLNDFGRMAEMVQGMAGLGPMDQMKHMQVKMNSAMSGPNSAIKSPQRELTDIEKLLAERGLLPPQHKDGEDDHGDEGDDDLGNLDPR